RRPPRAHRLRLPRPVAPAAVRCVLHRAAARQPLAGPGGGPAQGADLRAPGAARSLLGDRVGPQRRDRHPCLSLADGRARRARARALRPRPAALRPRGARPALRAAAHLARGQRHPRPHRGRRRRRLPAAAPVRARRQAASGVAGVALASARGLSMSLSARLTRQSGTSFYYAFRILPARKRRAIYALYSFCRVVDDCVDEPGGEGDAGLRRWAEEVRRCYEGRPSTELGRDLAEALFEFPIPRGCFEDIIAGCRMDLTTKRYATFPE